MSRRTHIPVKKIKPEVPLICTCQVCKIRDAINCCNYCGKIMCLADTFYCSKNSYCTDCFNEPFSSQFIIIEYIDDNKITCFKKLKRFMIYAISLEWIKGKKIEPFTNLF